MARLRNNFDLAVFGGTSSSGPTDNIEVLRNSESAFIDACTLLAPRADFVATELGGGLLLSGGQLAETEFFDFAAGTSAPGPVLTGAPLGASEAALSTGEAFLATTGAWLLANASGLQPLAPEPGLTIGFTTTLLPSGEVVTVGGDSASAQVFCFNAADGGLSSLPALAMGRMSHRASVFPSGELFVFGGKGSTGGILAFGEILEGSGWRATGPATARTDHVQLELPEGAVLLAGGLSVGAPLASVELVERVSPSLTDVSPAARPGSCGTVLADGRYLRVGGNPAGADVFDPGTGTWTIVAAPASSRSGCTANLLLDGRVLVVGGEASGAPLATAELFDPSTQTWSAAGSLSVARVGHSAATLRNGRVLVVGGFAAGGAALASTEFYDVATNTFVAGEPMLTARGDLALAMLDDGVVAVTGGSTSRGGPGLTAVEACAPDGTGWSAGPPMPTGRARHTLTPLTDGRVVALGGEGATPATADVIDPTGTTWATVTVGSARREGHVTLRLPFNRLLIAGGTSAPTLVERVDLSRAAPLATLTLSAGLDDARGAYLPDGRLHLAGGSVAAAFDEGRGTVGAAVSLDGRPPSRSPSPPSLTGAGFHPVETASDGTTLASPTNQPVVRFLHLATGHVRYAETEYFNDNDVALNVPGGWLPGAYAVTVLVNGQRSNPQLTHVATACSADGDCAGGFCAGDGVCCATPCGSGSCLSGACQLNPTQDAGTELDAGTDADAGLGDGGSGGAPDAGGPGADAGVTAPPGEPRRYVVGFGCAAAPPAAPLVALLLLAVRRRSRRR